MRRAAKLRLQLEGRITILPSNNSPSRNDSLQYASHLEARSIYSNEKLFALPIIKDISNRAQARYTGKLVE